MSKTTIERCAPIAILAVTLVASGLGQSADTARPVRNDVAQEGTELLIFRHQKLRKGGHEGYFHLSRSGVWPWFEKIGSRIVGQWQVIHPDGSEGDSEFDHGYRLARYASYDHWKATRQGHLLLGGNGPDYHRNRDALRARSHYQADSDGAHFLEGATATTRTYYMPALEEAYEPAPGAAEVHPVRNDVNWPAPEIIALERREVGKGTADALILDCVESVWPYLEKVGARVVGHWKAVYPPESGFEENLDHDELFLMVRFAGYEHWKAAQPDVIVQMGGDGPDYEAYREALRAQDEATRKRSLMFLQGHMYQSPPKFLPGLKESYRRAE